MYHALVLKKPFLSTTLWETLGITGHNTILVSSEIAQISRPCDLTVCYIILCGQQTGSQELPTEEWHWVQYRISLKSCCGKISVHHSLQRSNNLKVASNVLTVKTCTCTMYLVSSPGHSQFFNVECWKSRGPGTWCHTWKRQYMSPVNEHRWNSLQTCLLLNAAHAC